MLLQLRSAISNLNNSDYLKRLGERLWLPCFILLLQAFLTTHYLTQGESFLSHDSWLSVTAIFLKCLFRATLWASLFWWIVALPKSNWVYRSLLTVFLILILGAHYLESFLLSTYGMCFSHPVLLVLAGTNPQEAREFWNSSFSLTPLLRPTGEILGSLLLTWLLLGRRPKLERERERERE